MPYNRRLCTKWAEVMVAAETSGRRIDCADAWIAATALLADVPLVTHNRADYLGVPDLRSSPTRHEMEVPRERMPERGSTRRLHGRRGRWFAGSVQSERR